MKFIEKGFSTIPENREIYPVVISPRLITRWLLITIGLLAALSLTGQIIKYSTGHGNLFGFVPKFDLHEENNIPTYFETLQFLFAALLLGLIARVKNRTSDRYRIQWLALAVIFLILSIDETSSLHEQLSHPIKMLLNTSGMFYYAWVVAALPLLAITGIYFLKFLKDLPAYFRNLFLLAAVVFLSGAVGMELVEGWYLDTYNDFNLTYNLFVTVEEVLEMVGLVIFIRALSTYLQTLKSKLSFEFSGKS